ncbi:hypothetical protein ASPNIDRAFT_121921, partial [Aspergillus niger ATCC 1015]
YKGRYNENVRLAERRGKFNIDALKSAAAQSLQRCDTDIKNAKNPVGSEYMIMEKLPGRPLGDRWFELSDRERLKVLLQLVQLEAKLHAIELPASGSIYYASDLPSDSPRIVIPNSNFCIGPNAALQWWFEEQLAWLRTYGRPRFPFERAYRESMDYQLSDPSEHMESYLKIAPVLLPSNEFFSPPELSELDEQGKADALHDFRRRHTDFFYLAFTQRFNKSHFRAMDQTTNMLTRRIFSHAGDPWEGNNIPLQADLVLIKKSLHEYSTGPCPISFSTAKSDSIMHLQSMQEEIDLQLKHIRNAIGISVNGWTPPEEYEAACARARQMKIDGLASLDTDYEREMTNRHWPFDDHNEDE